LKKNKSKSTLNKKTASKKEASKKEASKKTTLTKQKPKTNERILKNTYIAVIVLLIIVILGFLITFISIDKTGKATGIVNGRDSGEALNLGFEDDFDLSVYSDGTEEYFVLEDLNYFTDLDQYYAEIGYDPINDLFYSGYIVTFEKPSALDKKLELDDSLKVNDKEKILDEKTVLKETISKLSAELDSSKTLIDVGVNINQVASKDEVTREIVDRLETEHNLNLTPITTREKTNLKNTLANLERNYNREITLERNDLERTKAQVSSDVIEYRQFIDNELERIKTDLSKKITDFDEKVISEHKDLVNAMIVDVTRDELEIISKNENVDLIYPNYIIDVQLDYSSNLLNLPTIWNDLGYTGEGVKIAILDTGVDYTHPDLGGCLGPGCKVVDGYNFISYNLNPMDDHGHGTHVAAIAAGTGASQASLKGVAPDALIYAYKVLNQDGSGSFNAILEGMERALDPNGDGDYSDRVDVVNMSLGANVNNPNHPASLYADKLSREGIVVVIAAGNSGPNNSTIATPAASRKAITVGASDDTDSMATFSSRGPTTIGTIKPDIVAPGVEICAAQTNNWLPNKNCIDQDHISISGTSMASPQVAGIAALLLEKYPSWSPDDIKYTLRNTTIDLGSNVYTQGHGRVDPLSAINQNQKPLIVEFVKGSIENNKTNFLFNLNNFVENQEYNYKMNVYSLLPGYVQVFLFDKSIDFTSTFVDANYVVSINELLDQENYFVEFILSEKNSSRETKEYFIFNKNIDYDAQNLPPLVPTTDYSVRTINRLLYADKETITFVGSIQNPLITSYKLLYKPSGAFSWEWTDDYVEYVSNNIPFSNQVMAKIDTSKLSNNKTYSFKFVYYYKNGEYLRERNLNSIACSADVSNQRNCVRIVSQNTFKPGTPLTVPFEHVGSTTPLRLADSSSHYNFYYQYADLSQNGVNDLIVFNLKKQGQKYFNVIKTYDSLTGQLLWTKSVDIGYLDKLTRYPIVDIDKDGKLEIIILSYDRLNASSPLAPKLYAIDHQGNIKKENQLTGFYNNSFPYANVYGLAVEDLTGNGNYEIIIKTNRVTCQDSRIHLFVFDNQFNILSHKDTIHGRNWLVNRQFPLDLTIGNFDLDSNTKEIAFLNYEGSESYKYILALYKYKLNGTILEFVSRTPIVETNYSGTVIKNYNKAISGDLDGDGIDEIIVSFIRPDLKEEEQVIVFKHDGSIYYNSIDTLASRRSWVGGFVSPKLLLDFDGDNSLDLLRFNLYGEMFPKIEVKNIQSNNVLKTSYKLDYVLRGVRTAFHHFPNTAINYYKNNNNEHFFALQATEMRTGVNNNLILLNQNLDYVQQYVLNQISESSCGGPIAQNTKTLFNGPYILDVDGDGFLDISTSVQSSNEAYIYTIKTNIVADDECSDCWSTYNFYLKNTNNFSKEVATIPSVAMPIANPVGGNFENTVMVSLSTPTEGAIIKYTIDGSEPLFSSSTYTSPVEINSTRTLKAKAFKEGYQSSLVMSETYQFPQVTDLVANPPSGDYTTAINLVLTTNTPGSVIKYTTNGSQPNQASQTYSAPIVINKSTTVKAQAYKDGIESSSVKTFTYVYPTVGSVVADPLPGNYPGTTNVTLSVPDTPGATIKYTLDGSTPGIGETFTYTGPISVTGATTIVALGYKENMNRSRFSSTFSYNQGTKVKKPVANPAPVIGTLFLYRQIITLSTETHGATIRYTLDGKDPTSNSPVYQEPIIINRETRLKARAYKDGMTSSDILSLLYRFPTHPIPAQSTSPDYPGHVGSFRIGAFTWIDTVLIGIDGSSPVTVTIDPVANVPGTVIRYNTDGKALLTPTHGLSYTGPITINQNASVCSRAFTPDVFDDTTPVIDHSTRGGIISCRNYRFNTVSNVIIDPAPSRSSVVFTNELTITMNTKTSGATIKYTVNGTTPSITNGITYTEPFVITDDTSLRSMAFKDGLSDSPISFGYYTKER
jgi:subtilisin family serine protease